MCSPWLIVLSSGHALAATVIDSPRLLLTLTLGVVYVGQFGYFFLFQEVAPIVEWFDKSRHVHIYNVEIHIMQAELFVRVRL